MPPYVKREGARHLQEGRTPGIQQGRHGTLPPPRHTSINASPRKLTLNTQLPRPGHEVPPNRSCHFWTVTRPLLQGESIHNSD